MPQGPDYPGALVCPGDRCLVATAALLRLQGPGPESIEGFASTLCWPGRQQHGSGAVDQQCSQVSILMLADAAEVAPLAGGVFSRGETEPACEVPPGRVALYIHQCGACGRCREDADAGNAQQPFGDGILVAEPGELAFDIRAPQPAPRHRRRRSKCDGPAPAYNAPAAGEPHDPAL